MSAGSYLLGKESSWPYLGLFFAMASVFILQKAVSQIPVILAFKGPIGNPGCYPPLVGMYVFQNTPPSAFYHTHYCCSPPSVMKVLIGIGVQNKLCKSWLHWRARGFSIREKLDLRSLDPTGSEESSSTLDARSDDLISTLNLVPKFWYQISSTRILVRHFWN